MVKMNVEVLSCQILGKKIFRVPQQESNPWPSRIPVGTLSVIYCSVCIHTRKNKCLGKLCNGQVFNPGGVKILLIYVFWNWRRALPRLICKWIPLLSCLWSFIRHLRRLPVSELEEEMKPMKLQPELASYAGTVLYPDSESAKWDVDGMHQMMWNSNIVCVALSKKLFETKIEIRIYLVRSTCSALMSTSLQTQG